MESVLETRSSFAEGKDAVAEKGSALIVREGLIAPYQKQSGAGLRYFKSGESDREVNLELGGNQVTGIYDAAATKDKIFVILRLQGKVGGISVGAAVFGRDRKEFERLIELGSIEGRPGARGGALVVPSGATRPGSVHVLFLLVKEGDPIKGRIALSQIRRKEREIWENNFTGDDAYHYWLSAGSAELCKGVVWIGTQVRKDQYVTRAKLQHVSVKVIDVAKGNVERKLLNLRRASLGNVRMVPAKKGSAYVGRHFFRITRDDKGSRSAWEGYYIDNLQEEKCEVAAGASG